MKSCAGRPAIVAHEVVAGHVEQALGDLAARDVGVHARAQRSTSNGLCAEHVARQAVADGVDHLRRRDAGLRQPDERLADAARAVLGGQPGDDEVAAGPRLLGRDRHPEPARRARHRLAHHLAKRHVQREQLDALDARRRSHGRGDTTRLSASKAHSPSPVAVSGHGEVGRGPAPIQPRRLLRSATAALRNARRLGALPSGTAGPLLARIIHMFRTQRTADLLSPPILTFPRKGGRDPQTEAVLGRDRAAERTRCDSAKRVMTSRAPHDGSLPPLRGKVRMGGE